MKTIYAFGCSVTHGADLVSINASEENVMLSYPVKIAQRLNLQCENWAIPGNSNENIYHNFMDMIPTVEHKDISFVIVGYTAPIRETWKSNGRYWQMIPCWCSTTTDLTKPYGYVRDPKPRWSETSPRVVSDNELFVDDLDQMYKLFSKHRWDEEEYTKKRTNYITGIRAYCKLHNIKLIETRWHGPIDGIEIDLTCVSSWLNQMRHPNREEHEKIADMIIGHYKL